METFLSKLFYQKIVFIMMNKMESDKKAILALSILITIARQKNETWAFDQSLNKILGGVLFSSL